ncbi:hypothetical protein D3C81_678390 [compost metagenome]
MAFDMSIFLSGVLSGAQVTRGRHIKQALAIQSAISERWGIANPWLWKRKHLIWFRRHHLKNHSESSRYYYLLTMRLIVQRMERPCYPRDL